MRTTERATSFIDHDVRLCHLIDEFFAESDYAIRAVHNGTTGLAHALDESFDLILFDIILPGLDSFEVLTQLRRRSSVPVIMLTARGARENCMQGLNTGADDYLAKPLGPEELAARIAAVLRRTQGAPSARIETVSVRRLRLSAASRCARMDAQNTGEHTGEQ